MSFTRGKYDVVIDNVVTKEGADSIADRVSSIGYRCKVVDSVSIADALKAAVAAIYFDDNSDYGCALWQVVRALGGDEACDLLDEDGSAAYAKYCEDDS
jgi:hypothetical protein